MKTRKILRLTAILLALPLLLASCGGDDDKKTPDGGETSGNIPGLGNTGGELAGTPFTLPTGVTLTGEITGNGRTSDYWNDVHSYRFTQKDCTAVTMTSSPKTRAEEAATGHFGSGFGFVTLRIPLNNGNDSPTTVTFPAALIMRSLSGDTQHGVLIKKATVTIPAHTDYILNLAFYCGNEDRAAAWGDDQYMWGVVSNAAPLLDLCERVKNKKINIEEYDPAKPEDRETYNSHLFMLQAAVWEVTDGNGLSEGWTIPYINSLPNS